LKKLNLHQVIPVAAVATGFPSGQYGIETRLAEIRDAVRDGASEIDIVINRTAALQGKWLGKFQLIELIIF
jgi:deoxyribose-phosphate aldolase